MLLAFTTLPCQKSQMKPTEFQEKVKQLLLEYIGGRVQPGSQWRDKLTTLTSFMSKMFLGLLTLSVVSGCFPSATEL